MSTLASLLDELESLMELQVQGIEDFQTTQIRVKQHLVEKDWPALERGLHDMEFKTQGLHHVESRRHDVWQKIRHLTFPERHADFYQVLTRLDPPRREKLGTLHKQIKLSTLKLKGVTMGIDSYIQATSAVVRAVISEIKPVLKGRLYSRHGQVRTAEAGPMVLNQSF